jgi:hypothetical protein
MSQEQDIKEIVSLGYDECKAKAALKACGNVDDAIDHLFSGGKIFNRNNEKASPVATTTRIRQYDVVDDTIEQPPPVIRNDQSVLRESRSAAIEDQTRKPANGKHTIVVQVSDEERTTEDVVGAFRVPGTALDDVETPEEMEAQAVDAAHYFTATARVVQSEEEELNMLEERVQTQEERIRTQEERLHQLMTSREDGVVAPVNENEERRQVKKVTPDCKLSKKRWRAGVVTVILVVVAIALAVVLSRESDTADDSFTTDDTGTPNEEYTNPAVPVPNELSELLASKSFDGGATMRTKSTPQNRALNWLAQNTHVNNYTDAQKVQRYTLATFYFSTKGKDWDYNPGWLSDDNECNWFNRGEGSFCLSDGGVSNLILYSNHLQGEIPPELGLLSDSLEMIELDVNVLTESIPSQLGLLTNLIEFKLDQNELRGSLFTELGKLTSLRVLNLIDNNFEYTIPTEMGLMSNLEDMYMSSNRLEGTIPSQLGLLKYLKGLSLHSNHLTGTIPSEVYTMTNLDVLHLYNNQCTGNFTCPSFIYECWVSCTSNEQTCRSLSK